MRSRKMGSSPRMRGTPGRPSRYSSAIRIIPAHAGNTSRSHRLPACWRDHPRACGEHCSRFFKGQFVEGSSPRMRGTHRDGADDGDPTRIIPAHAGNTGPLSAVWHSRQDHPRACGEHPDGTTQIVTQLGSSPRMRGTLSYPREPRASTGIIPAHAGNTVHGIPAMPPSWDHPRACGEHKDMPLHCDEIIGSSPRMRGTRPVGKITDIDTGIIPAHAGNTCP